MTIISSDPNAGPCQSDDVFEGGDGDIHAPPDERGIMDWSI